MPSSTNYTKRQGQFLAFIFYYTKINKIPPAEKDIQIYFQIESSSVHTMIKTLLKKELITKIPGKSRSITINIDRAELPDLE
mgnify:CR=1 FL=1